MKNNFIATILISLALIVSACSTTQGKKAKTKEVPTSRADDSLVYASLQNKDDLTAADCPKSADAWKSLGWQRLLKAGRACFVYKEIFRLQEIGYHLSERDNTLPWGPYFLSLVSEFKGSLASALWYIELAKKRSAQEPLVDYQRARLLYLSGSKDEAVVAIEQLSKNFPQLTEALLFTGQVYAASGRHADAIRVLRQYLTTSPRDTTALIGVARSYDEMGKFDLALPIYQKLVFLDQGNWEARLRIAQLNEKLSDNKQVVLASYENLLNFVRNSRQKIDLPINLEAKIRDIKNELKQSVSMRQPTSKTLRGK